MKRCMKNLIFILSLSFWNIGFCQSDTIHSDSTKRSNFNLIYSALSKLAQAEGHGSYIIFDLGSEQLFQVAGSENDPIYYCEMTTILAGNLMNNYSAVVQEEKLLASGWELPLEINGNYSKFITIENEAELNALTNHFVELIFDLYSNVQLDLNNIEIVLD